MEVKGSATGWGEEDTTLLGRGGGFGKEAPHTPLFLAPGDRAEAPGGMISPNRHKTALRPVLRPGNWAIRQSAVELCSRARTAAAGSRAWVNTAGTELKRVGVRINRDKLCRLGQQRLHKQGGG